MYNKRTQFRVHRLVATMFLPNPDNLPVVNHKDGIRDSNKLDNLEWVSHSDNSKHAHKNGMVSYCIGAKHRSSKLTDDNILEIKEFYDSGLFSKREISYLYNVHDSLIGRVIRKERWKHVK